jgi:hypothetical protein
MPTGNSVVPNVDRVQVNAATNPSLAGYDNSIAAVSGGLVYSGRVTPAGSPNGWVYDLNKIAVNAELVANGYTPLP